MSGRAKTGHKRCGVCRLNPSVCLCGELPCLQTRTRVLIAMHRDERWKTSNTGLLAAACLARSEVYVHGPTQSNPEGDPPPILKPDETGLVLFPSEDAVPLDQIDPNPAVGAYLLAVPDATWRQAAKMARRVPLLAGFTNVRLPGVPVSSYAARRAPNPGNLATMEAVAQALAILEGPQHGPLFRHQLETVFRKYNDRLQWMKGRLAANQVTGGLPGGATILRRENKAW